MATTPIHNQEEALTRARLLRLLPSDADIDHVQKRDVPYDSWAVSFATLDRDRNGNKLHSGEIVLLATDGSLVRFTDLKRGHSSSGMAFDVQEEKVNKEQAIAIADAFIENHNWKLDAAWQINPYPESEYRTRGDDKSLHKIRSCMRHG